MVQLKLLWMIEQQLEEGEQSQELASNVNDYLLDLLVSADIEEVRERALVILSRKENKELFPIVENMIIRNSVPMYKRLVLVKQWQEFMPLVHDLSL